MVKEEGPKTEVSNCNITMEMAKFNDDYYYYRANDCDALPLYSADVKKRKVYQMACKGMDPPR